MYSNKILGMMVAWLLLLCSCGSKNNGQQELESLWSINEFIIDQHNQKVGEPIVLTKIVTLNGKTDTTYEALDQVDWATVFKIFGATDISHPKYASQYTVSNFDDNFLEMSSLIYTAKDPNLFVQRVDINYDNETMKISSIYISTNKDNWLKQKQQQLIYDVNKKILINENESSRWGKDKELTIEYKFP